MKKKQLLSLVFLLTFSSPLAMAHTVQERVSDPFYYSNPDLGSEVQVTFDGLPLDMGGLSAMKSERSIMVPVRAVAESIGAAVEWNKQSRTAVVTNGMTTIRFQADSANAYVNDSPTELPEKTILKQDRLLVPMVMLKRLADNKEYQIVYSNQLDLVEITSIQSDVELEIPMDDSFAGEEGSPEGVLGSESSDRSPSAGSNEKEKEKVFIPSLDSLISDQK